MINVLRIKTYFTGAYLTFLPVISLNTCQTLLAHAAVITAVIVRLFLMFALSLSA